MLFLILIYYLVRGVSESIDASPIPSLDKLSSESSRCTDLTHCRTVWNIIWSCLTTIFSCTWIAIHPNIPCPRKQNSVVSFAEHRLPLFVCALLVPEYVLAWAIRQFLRARKIAGDNKGEFNFGFNFYHSNSLSDVQWSTTHGFFIAMGGFHLFRHSSEEMSNDGRYISQEDDEPLHPLQASDLVHCNGYYESFVMPTKAEITDKGKSDWLAKSLVLLQTSWFVIQCIARGIKHLPVTHLEIVTLAYAAMNFVIYTFWWNKPLNFNRPVRVFRKSESGDTQTQVTEPISEGWKLTWDAFIEGLATILGFIAGGQDGDVNLTREDRVPRFWANSTGSDHVIVADMIVLVVGVCFGAIHCIAWIFPFPTHIELLIWRVSSVAITAVPIYIPLMFLLAILANSMDFEFTTIAVVSSVLPAGILYILARAVTLVLAFTSLRDLPPGAYETVYWTTFIPHI